GIRDDLVTGVQTCALPIWRVEGLSRGGGERIDGRGVTAHGGGEDARDHEPGEPGWELVDGEGRIDGVAAHRGPRIRAREPQAGPYQQEERELQDDEHPGTDEGPLRVPEAPGGEQALHDQMIGAVGRAGE